MKHSVGYDRTICNHLLWYLSHTCLTQPTTCRTVWFCTHAGTLRDPPLVTWRPSGWDCVQFSCVSCACAVPYVQKLLAYIKHHKTSALTRTKVLEEIPLVGFSQSPCARYSCIIDRRTWLGLVAGDTVYDVIIGTTYLGKNSISEFRVESRVKSQESVSDVKNLGIFLH